MEDGEEHYKEINEFYPMFENSKLIKFIVSRSTKKKK